MNSRAERMRNALVEQNERLRHLLLKLRRRQLGRKSERLTDEQLQFAFEEIEATLAENAAEAGKRSPATREQQRRRRRARCWSGPQFDRTGGATVRA